MYKERWCQALGEKSTMRRQEALDEVVVWKVWAICTSKVMLRAARTFQRDGTVCRKKKIDYRVTIETQLWLCLWGWVWKFLTKERRFTLTVRGITRQTGPLNWTESSKQTEEHPSSLSLLPFYGCNVLSSSAATTMAAPPRGLGPRTERKSQ